MRETHYVPALAEHNGHQRLTACNIWIHKDAHTAEPTCPTCREYVEDGCRELSAEDVFGAFDPLAVVKHVPFSSTDHYTPRTK